MRSRCRRCTTRPSTTTGRSLPRRAGRVRPARCHRLALSIRGWSSSPNWSSVPVHGVVNGCYRLRSTSSDRPSRPSTRPRSRRAAARSSTLASHGVETQLVGMTVGPTVTRYELELGPGVKVARVTSLKSDIAYAMAAVDVRILAPIPGRSAIGVEVPNHTRQLVSLGDIMVSAEAERPPTRSTSRSARTSPAVPCSSTSPRRRTCSSPVPPVPASRAGSTASSRRC